MIEKSIVNIDEERSDEKEGVQNLACGLAGGGAA